MSATNIEWATQVWNPTTGCNKVSQGCKNCYAEVMHKRLIGMRSAKYVQPFLCGAVEHPEALQEPFNWKKPERVFVNSMSDLFHDDVSFNFQYKVFEMMHLAHWHTFIFLTKREHNLHRVNDIWFHLKRNYPDGVFPSPNVIGGVSVEDQDAANKRIPKLLQVSLSTRVLSCEPLLGPVNLSSLRIAEGAAYLDALKGEQVNGPQDEFIVLRDLPKIHWVICGGESGHHARPMHPDWARSLRDQCTAAGVAFFFKQWGEWLPHCQANCAIGEKYNYTEFPSPHNPDKMNRYFKTGKKNSIKSLDNVEHHSFPINKAPNNEKFN